MKKQFRKTSISTAMLLALVVTAGCDSNDNPLSVVTDETQQSGEADGNAGETDASPGTSTDTDSSNETDTSGDTGTTGSTDGAGTDADGSSAGDNTTGNSTSDSSSTDEPTDAGDTNDSNGDPDSADTTTPAAEQEYEAVYLARFVSTWSADTHPVNFPDNPHFSPLTGAAHSEQAVFWQRGQNATDGIEQMAETGGTTMLLDEIQLAIDEGRALSTIQGGGIALSPGATEVEFRVKRDYPLVTLVSMLAPSPDWFIGIHDQSMLDQNGDYLESLTVELNLYDSGTDAGVRYDSADEDSPRSPIALVNSFPSDSDFIEGQPSVGRLIITRVR